MARLTFAAVTLSLVGIAGLVMLFSGGPELPGAILSVSGGAASAAAGGVALLSPAPGEAPDKGALAAGLVGLAAVTGFLGWSVGIL